LTVYADTSFFISIYVQDRHSDLADQMLRSGHSLWLTPFHRAEWTHAISQQVFRKDMSRAEAERVRSEFEADAAAGLWVAVDVPDRAFDLCSEFGRRHGPRLGIRTLDNLHVACAIELKAESFWTFDERQRKLAKAIGLRTK